MAYEQAKEDGGDSAIKEAKAEELAAKAKSEFADARRRACAMRRKM